MISEFPELKTSQKNLAYSNDSGDFQKVTHCSLETKVKKFQQTLPCVVGVAIAQGHFGSSEGPPWEKREKPAEAAL